MSLIQLDRVAKSHAGRSIFRDLSWEIREGDRVGLVGPNGSGKTTLLRLIAGELGPDEGELNRRRGVDVGYLPQEVELPSGRSLFQVASALPPKLAAVHAQLERVEQRLADPEVYSDDPKLGRALALQEDALRRYEKLGGAQHEGRVRSLLLHLGFGPGDESLPAESLSGGQTKLVALVRLALDRPQVLLLDEPDNHLDLEAKQKLEKFIRAYPGAVIVVSHDRYLLDECVDRIAEIEDGRLTLYRGAYTAYAAERERRRLAQQRQHAVQQKEIARSEASIRRFELWASMVVNERHARQARSRRKMIERMDKVEAVREARQMGLRLDGWRGSEKALEIRELEMGFDAAANAPALFSKLELLIRHGERVGLVGPNGSGKSVLFRLILGELEPRAGSIRIGPSSRIGYYAQEHETLDDWLERTPLERVRWVSPMTEEAGVAFLLRFAFSYDQVRQPIGTLSGGECSRLQLASLMLEKPNLLLLDEPTNNLDIPSAEVLEEALDEFEGALFVISHDRYLLDRVADRVVELRDGELRSYDGGYTDYLAARS